MSETQSVGHSFSMPTLDLRVEQAHDLCVAALKDHPNGMIPVQSVYEMLLRIIGREDVIAELEADQQRFDPPEPEPER